MEFFCLDFANGSSEHNEHTLVLDFYYGSIEDESFGSFGNGVESLDAFDEGDDGLLLFSELELSLSD